MEAKESTNKIRTTEVRKAMKVKSLNIYYIHCCKFHFIKEYRIFCLDA